MTDATRALAREQVIGRSIINIRPAVRIPCKESAIFFTWDGNV